jgi:FkbH-like protein
MPMRLIEALQVVNAARDRAGVRRFEIVCGFTPLHLATFLAAHLQLRVADERVQLAEGLFGDLLGNVRRAAAGGAQGAAVFLEWTDLDPRLGLRHAGDWAPAALPDIVRTTGDALGRLAAELPALASAMPVAVALPSLGLPPVAYTPGWQSSPFELELRALVARCAADLGAVPRLRIVSEQRLVARSPAEARRSVKGDLATGFPYSHTHADELAELAAALLVPGAPKKGLITDLDDTLWSGILGEVGLHGVAWDLDRHAQAHGLYQQTLAALAASGVLVAVVSKNDPALVAQAFEREDLRLRRASVFPILASWGAKSAAVAQVLEHWNVGADSVVFVDDSPLELAEVQQRFPDVECVRFPADDPDAVYAVLGRLRDLFGKEAVLAEDALRLDSLRSAGEFRNAAAGDGLDQEHFLAGLGASLSLRFGRHHNQRAFELINKTNQFNVNGERYTEAAWQALLERGDAFVLTVDYADKFGPLGTIAVLTGVAGAGTVSVERWVMSCRAFARRIEHATLRAVFEEFDADRVVVAYRGTDRNGPTRDFLAGFVAPPEAPGPVELTREAFEARCPPTYQTIDRIRGSEYIYG